MAAATLIVYLQSQLESNDALFLFISSSLAVNILMVALSCATVWLSFQPKFKSGRLYLAVLYSAVALCAIGAIGVFSAGLDRYFFDVIKPLNYMLMLEAGIIFSLCALTYEHPKVDLRLPSFDTARLRRMANGLSGALSIPSHSGGSRPHAA
jgi:hypothetical protein